MKSAQPFVEDALTGKMQRQRLLQKQPRLRLDPAQYKALKNQVLERDGWRCQDCGSVQMLEVHHVNPRSKLGHDASENLITLCVDCHRRRHGRKFNVRHAYSE
jgi:5-methylcytosine-specific restriction endonuclease McrA